MGRLKLNIGLRKTKYSENRFNLTTVKSHNSRYVNVSPEDVFFSNLFRFDEIGCNKYEMIIFKLLFLSYMPTTLYVSFYYTNSIAMLFIVH